MWQEDWAAPLIVTMVGENDNAVNASRNFR
jgi:hypothetical protein